MRKNLQRHIAVLNAVIADLDNELFANPSWRLRQANVGLQAGDALATDQLYEQLRLENDLARDPVYRARVRALEVVQILRTVSGTDTLGKSETDRESVQSMAASTTDAAPVATEPQAANEAFQTASQPPDDLTKIRGISQRLADALAAEGVTRFAQIAQWRHEDIVRVSQALNLGRMISQQNWIEQAAMLDAKSPSLACSEESAAQKPSVNATPPIIENLSVRAEETPNSLAPDEDSAQPATDYITAASHTLFARATRSAIVPNPVPLTPSPSTQSQSDNEVSDMFVPQVLEQPRRANNIGPHPIFHTPFSIAKVAQNHSRDADRQRKAETPPDAMSGNANDNSVARGNNEAVQPDKEDGAAAPTAKETRTARLRRMRSELKVIQPMSSSVPATLQTDTMPAPLPLPTNPQVKNPFSSVRSGSAHPSDHAGSDHPGPPPIPDRAERFALRQKDRASRRQQRSTEGAQSGEQFGDGVRWRQRGEDALPRPVQPDLDAESKIYSHHEEASVEIVRPMAEPKHLASGDVAMQAHAKDVQLPLSNVEKTKSPASRVANRVRSAFWRN